MLNKEATCDFSFIDIYHLLTTDTCDGSQQMKHKKRQNETELNCQLKPHLYKGRADRGSDSKTNRNGSLSKGFLAKYERIELKEGAADVTSCLCNVIRN